MLLVTVSGVSEHLTRYPIFYTLIIHQISLIVNSILNILTGEVRFELTTGRLTADSSTTELLSTIPPTGLEPVTNGLKGHCSTN